MKNTLMKTKNILATMLMLFATIGFTACGDDEESLPPLNPTFEAVSGKYTVTTSGSPYESIELTVSGNYIITTDNAAPWAAPAPQAESSTVRTNFLYRTAAAAQTRATNYNGIIYGRYTELGNNRFALEGFGTLEIVYGEDGTEIIGFELTPDGEGPVSLSVSKETTMPDSDATDKLCRTWRVDKMTYVYSEDGHVLGEFTITADNYKEFDDEIDGFPTEALFSKSGTYMVYYTDGSLGISSWKWKDEAALTFLYAWDNQWYDDDFATVSFSGNTAMVYEVYEDYGEKEETYTYMTAL
mgnify:CR=1 FL=1